MNFGLCLLCVLNIYFCLFPLKGNQKLIPVRILSDLAKRKKKKLMLQDEYAYLQ